MDDVEELLQSLESMSPEEREEELERFKSQCIYPICPTYNDCAREKGELL